MSKHEHTKELVATATKSLVIPEDIDFTQDMQDFGANYTADQMAMPFLSILQGLSPQVTRGKEQFIKEAQPGMFFNTVTNEIFDGEIGLNIIFGNFKESYIEWVPRSEGGGIVQEYTALEGSKATLVVDPLGNRIITDASPIGKPGNVLNLTHTRMAFIVSEDLKRWNPCLISMTSSQLRTSSHFNTRHKLLEWTNPQTKQVVKGPPLPLCIWHVTTKLQQNDSGSWYGWNIAFKGFLNEMDGGMGMYRDAKEFVKSSKAVKAMDNAAVELAKTMTLENEVPQRTATASRNDMDDDIPF